MQNALHIRTVVLPGKRIEVAAPQLNEGAAVEVFLVLPETAETPRRRSALQIIAALNGHRLFPSAEAVDQHLGEERDSWDR